MTADVVLWLDLADANPMDDDAVRERIPRGAHVLRLTEHGADRSRVGVWLDGDRHWTPSIAWSDMRASLSSSTAAGSG